MTPARRYLPLLPALAVMMPRILRICFLKCIASLPKVAAEVSVGTSAPPRASASRIFGSRSRRVLRRTEADASTPGRSLCRPVPASRPADSASRLDCDSLPAPPAPHVHPGRLVLSMALPPQPPPTLPPLRIASSVRPLHSSPSPHFLRSFRPLGASVEREERIPILMPQCAEGHCACRCWCCVWRRGSRSGVCAVQR